MLAHIKDEREQKVEEHLKNVANYCNVLGKKIGLSKVAELSGWLHDIGKMTTEFEDYIREVNAKQEVHKKGPDHSTAGAVWIMELAKQYQKPIMTLTAQIIAVVIMGHHGGLIDIIDLNGESPFINRLEKIKDDLKWVQGYKQVKKEMNQVLDVYKLKQLFEEASNEIAEQLSRIKKIAKNGKEQKCYCGVLCKFLYSCLIDADRYDTATFMDNEEMKLPQGHQEIWEEFVERFEERIEQFSMDTSINKLRNKISFNCYHSASNPTGIYTLNCPTGSGKTMASLRFALQHAKKYHKERIFYIIPFITITEQNTAEIKKILSKVEKDELVERNILELHSAKENETVDEKVNVGELVAERLEHPMIFTTMVRFLNTFFGSGTKNMRGAHQFANSIIIFDEIQTLSPKCIALFNTLVNFLSEMCGTTIVLSTATQPLLNYTPEKIPTLKIAKQELSGCQLEDYRAFKRTEIIDITKVGGYSSGQLSDMIWEQATMKGNVLVVLNTKAAVIEVYEKIHEKYGDILEERQIKVYVLTTQLYPKHRKEKINEIRNLLQHNRPIIVISTQIIEAGVDISFKTVFRSLAGLDSVIQSAGRCNRNGENGIGNFGQVYIVNPSFESLGSLVDIKKSKEALEVVLEINKQNKSLFDNDLSSFRAIQAYFKEYYCKQQENMTYKFKIDKQFGYEMYDLLSDNAHLFSVKYKDVRDERLKILQSFKSAGSYFRAIDEHGKPLIISHGDGKEIVSELFSSTKNKDRYDLLHKLQAYTVNVSDNVFKALGNAVTYYESLGIYVLNEAYYDETYGVTTTPVAMDFYNF